MSKLDAKACSNQRNTLKYKKITFFSICLKYHGSDSKASVCNAGEAGLIPGLGRSPGKGNGSPLQYSCLENPMDRGAW